MSHRQRGFRRDRRRPGRPDVTHPDRDGTGAAGPDAGRPVPEHVLEALLSGARPGQEDAVWQPVGDVLAALTGPLGGTERRAEAGILAEFRALPRRPGGRARRRGRGPALALRRPTGPVTAVAAGAVVLGGLTAAAYSGELPAPVLRLAHLVGAPTAAQASSPARPTASTGGAGPARHPAPHPDTSPSPAGSPGGRQRPPGRSPSPLLPRGSWPRGSWPAGPQPPGSGLSGSGAAAPSASAPPSGPAWPRDNPRPSAQPSPRPATGDSGSGPGTLLVSPSP